MWAVFTMFVVGLSLALGYLVVWRLVLRFASRFSDPGRPDDIIRTHLIAFPFLLGTTAFFAFGSGHFNITSFMQGIGMVPYGFTLGLLCFLLVIGIQYALGWITFPGWGWQSIPVRQVLSAVVYQIIGHATVAFNEELAFRGYGYLAFRDLLGASLAALIMLILFIRLHERTAITMLYIGTAGAWFMLCRWLTGSIWFGFGFHWAWNIAQTAILGNQEAMPSLRPLHVVGPSWWVGRPGVHGGMMSVFANIGFIIVALLYASYFQIPFNM